MNATVTLNRFVLTAGTHTEPPPRDIATLLALTAFAAKVIARDVRRAGLVGRFGLVGEKNPAGDAQKKLDVFANQVAASGKGGSG